MIAIRNAVRVSDPIATTCETAQSGASMDWSVGSPQAQHVALWRYMLGCGSQPEQQCAASPQRQWSYERDLCTAVARGESDGLDAAFQIAAAAAHGDETAAELLVAAATSSVDEAVRRSASYALTVAGISDATYGQHAVTRLIGVLERGPEALEVPPCDHGDHIDRHMNVLVMVVHALGQLAGCMPPWIAAKAARAIATARQHATADIEHCERTLPEATRLLCVIVLHGHMAP
eukprot:COSAG02_NODE_7196_length_3125_cov_1.842697_2_plen_233_part_00